MEIPKEPTVRDFYYRQKQWLGWFALWPAKPEKGLAFKVAHAIYFWFLYIFWIFWFGLSMFIKLVLIISELDEIIKVFYIFVTICSYETKFVNIKYNNHGYLELFERVHDECFEPRNKREREIFREAGILSCKVRNIYGYISCTTLNALILMTIFVSGRELPFSSYNPLDTDITWVYLATFLYQYLALTITAIVDVSFDSLCPSLYIFIMAQLDILADRLSHLGVDPSTADINTQLKHCVRYYMHIENLARSVETVVTWPISLQIFCSVLVLVANFYAMSMLADDYGNFVRFFIYQICMLSQIFLLCFFANGIMERSERLSHEIYRSNWVGWSKEDRKMMLLMMLRFSTPIKIRTINRNYAFSLVAFSSQPTVSLLRCPSTAYKSSTDLLFNEEYEMDRREYNERLLDFYKYQVKLFRALALWRLSAGVAKWQSRLYECYYYYIFIFWLCSLSLGLLIRFFSAIEHLLEVIKVFSILATTLAVVSKYIVIRLKHENFRQLFEQMNEPFCRPSNAREVQILKAAAVEASSVRNWYGMISLIACNLMLLTPYIVDNRELPLPMSMPLSSDEAWSYALLYIYQYIALSLLCYINIATDTILISFLIFIKCQLAILGDRMINLGAQPKVLQHEIGVELRACVIYYDKIARMKCLAEELINIPGSVQIFCSVMVLVANFYAISTNADNYPQMIKFGIYQLCMMSQIFMLCFYASEVTVKSASMSHSLYMSGWVDWNRSNRRMCLSMMSRFDQPLYIRTINPTYSFNLAAFTTIVNSSYSYFALLKRVNG